MAEFKISIPSLADPVNDTYDLPVFFDYVQTLDVILYKTTNEGILDSVTLKVEGAVIESTGTSIENVYMSNTYEGHPITLVINRTDLGSFVLSVSAVSHHTIYVEGRRSVFSCPQTLNMIGEEGVDTIISFELVNLDPDNPHTINISDDYAGESSIGIYHSSIRATQQANNGLLVMAAGNTYNMRFIVKNTETRRELIRITIMNAMEHEDTFSINCNLDIIDSLKLYGDSMVRRLFAEEVLSSSVRIGGAKILFDEAAQRLRFLIHDKEQSALSTSTAFVTDILEHNSQQPKSRLQILPSGEVQLKSISSTGVETIALEMGLNGKLRIQSGITFAPSIINKDTSNDFELHINIDDPHNPALQLKSGSDVKLHLGA